MISVPSPATPSRRAVLAAGTLAALPLALTAAPAGAAPRARRRTAAPLGAVTSPVPDPLPYRGSWQRTADGGQRAAAPAGGTALAMTEHRTGARSGVALRVAADPATPNARGGLVLRAAADGSAGYALTLEPANGQVRLTDLADGTVLASGAAGPGELLEVATDGPALTVHVDGRPVLAVHDHRHRAGHTGLFAAAGTVLLGPPRAWTVTTDLTGWTGDPGWTPTPLGLTADAPAGTNLRTLAAEEAYDTSLQADVVVHDPYAVAALLVRADATGSRGYAVEVDPNQGRLRLYRVDGNTTLASHAVPVLPGTVHRLRVEAEGRRLRVHWQSDFLRPDGYAPVIDTEDPDPDPHLSGRHGLLAYNGRVSYENVTAPGAAELPGGTTESGTWTRDLAGLRGHDGVRTAPAPAGPGLVVSADVRLAGARAAGLLVRGHAVLLDRQAGAVRLLDHARGTLLASAPPPVRPLRDGDLVRLEVHLLDGEFTVHADGVRVIDSAPAATTGGTVGLVADGGTAFFREVYAVDSRDHFTEPYRPAFHHSQRSGSASDPNGLVCFDGEYHLFHQDQGRWAHAVSTDLLHWRSLPRALDWNAYGHCWSGSAVADLHDASGLFDGGSGLIAYYTSHHPDRIGGNQSVRAAYSTDRGRSWQWYGGAEPLVGNPGGPDGGWDFRDPKVLRDEARDQWVMVVSGGDHVRFLTSRDLLHWTHVSSFGYGPWVTAGVWECPDLFPLPVDGDPGRTAWVLTLSTGAVRATDGSAAVYLTGTWDGTAFTPDQAPGGWLRSDHGRDFYAAITFDNTPDGRRIWLGWTTNWDYPFSAPTGPWQGQHSVPRVLSLAAGPAGHPVLRQWPVAELAALRAGSTVRTGLTAGPGLPDPCAGLTGTAYEIEAELAFPAEGAATDCAFLLRGKEGRAVRVGYDPGRGRLYLDRADSGRTDFTRWFAGRAEAPLAAAPDGGGRTVRLRILVDSSSVEVFGGAGEAVLTGLVLPDPDAAGLSFTADGGAVRLVTLAHHPLGSTCRVGGAPGRTLPAAPPPGEFRTDLGALTVTPAGRWAPTGAGLTCVFDRDSDALSTRRFADLELTTLLRLGGADGVRGAASLLWRASADGADGYVLNVDPDLRAVRLVVRRGGSFDDAAALARVSLLVRHGVTYHLRVVHQGTRIRVFLDGSGIIDLTDPGAAFASGHVGLNVFGGRAGHQDTYAKEL
ncbi:glycoside hydrolase family 32 protein [Streptomyces sp. NRRL F-5727]|uniref:glycoside hydrolase family 32 protein n=1 Tax=Streptomyces sp. NRRL F-5727 TaxID=1463871 RepID=UPI0004C64CCA|nr:glycoside hydrolase family 32 protein [Streptomyces sp. NRRL F-5727]